MILVMVRMKASPNKKKELSQAISSLRGSIKSEKGCRRCDFFHGMEDENILCLVEEWENRSHLEAHQKSESFKVLRGAMNLLEGPGEILSYEKFKEN